jgi:Cd2+/Zn2+-exporting ATPase
MMSSVTTTKPTNDSLDHQNDHNHASHEEQELSQLPWMIRLTIVTLISVLAGWITEDMTNLPIVVPWIFFAVAYIAGGFYSVQEAWESLQERQFDVNFLMIIAAIGAALVGQPLEGAVLMFLFSLSHTLEIYAMGRTYASIRALMDMTPKIARVLRTDDAGNETTHELPVEQVAVDDLVLVRPGEQLPTDGIVEIGESAVNEASITGESMPVEKHNGQRVYAGTINGQGALQIRVTTAVADSVLSRMVKMVSEAREQKAKSQKFTDKAIGQYYAYAVVGITLLAIAIPVLFLGWDFREAFYRGMTLMVVASPCALVISIPAALLSALASSARGGVLFKGGAHLETATKVQTIAFDKTGTLTTGKPSLVAIIPFQATLPQEIPCCYQHTPPAENDTIGELSDIQIRLLAAAASIEHYSEHPLARAIERKATERGIEVPPANEFEATTGSGAQGYVADTLLRIGRPEIFRPLPAEIEEQIKQQQEMGRTVVILGNHEPWGLLALADTIRPESREVVAQLKQAGIANVVLLTGDNRYVAHKLAAEIGIDEVYSELMPEQKVDTIRKIQRQHGVVGMVGDGVNDAPALATADLGIAMGAAGTDVALESADVLLMSDDLSRLPGVLGLARRTRQVVRMNLTFAFVVMAVLMVMALAGSMPLTLAVLGHEGSTLIVVANGLRLLLPWK